MSNTELTPEQKARLLAPYLGQPCTAYGSDGEFKRILRKVSTTHAYVNVESEFPDPEQDMKWPYVKLLLRPLAQIRKDEAIEVAKLIFDNEPYLKYNSVSVDAWSHIKHVNTDTGWRVDIWLEGNPFHQFDISLRRYWSDGRDEKRPMESHSMALVIAYLQQRGFDFGQFIALNHPLNGKTLYDLGLAVYETPSLKN